MSASGAPATIVVDIPPGMTPAQFEALQSDMVTTALVVAVAFAVVLWDYMQLLPDELKLYQYGGKPTWTSVATYVFIILRYTGILATFPALFFTSIQSQFCQEAVSISQAGQVLVVGTSGLLFVYRVLAHYKENMVVCGLLSAMYTVMVGAWIAVATQWKATVGAATPYGSNCQLTTLPSWTPISWAASTAFTATILFFTLVLSRDHTPRKNRANYLIYRDFVTYMVISLVTNIVVLIIDSQGSSMDRTKINGMPFATLVFYAMGCRVFLNHRMLQKKQLKEQGLLPTGTFGPATFGGGVGSTHQLNPYRAGPESFHPISKHDPSEAAPFSSYGIPHEK